MKKYNNYKKYYESHKEQEKQRYLAYYYANRERILAERREKRKNAPKKVKLTPKDYQILWSEFWFWTNTNLPFITGVMEDLEKEYLERKKISIAKEKIKMKKVSCNKCGYVFEVEDNEEFGYCPFCENDQVEINVKERIEKVGGKSGN